MMPLIILFFLIFGFEISSWADGGGAKLIFAPTSQIQGLTLSTDSLVVNEDDFGKQLPVLVLLQGDFKSKGKELVCHAVGVEGEKNEFRLVIDERGHFSQWLPIYRKTNLFLLKTVSDSGSVESMEFSIEYTAKGWHWGFSLFRINGVRLSNISGTAWSILPSWTPTYGNHRFKFIGSLGLMPLRSINGSYYALFEYGIAGSVRTIDQFWIEGAGGLQYWSDQSTHSPWLGANLAYRFRKKPVSHLDLITFGYSLFFTGPSSTSEIRLGIGLVL